MLTFVTATRQSQADFELGPLAASLRRLGQVGPVRLLLATHNTQPLADHYNAAIEASEPDDLLVFIHDDVGIDDWLAGSRLAEAVMRFDVVGVTGNQRRQHGQETWSKQPGRLLDGQRLAQPFDHGHLSGAVAHGNGPGAAVSMYGPSPRPVQLLDGLLLAARGMRLRRSNVRFDPAFAFHFHDLDFCRTARRAGLSLGTWPLAVTHASAGEPVRSAAWQEACTAYLHKWGES